MNLNLCFTVIACASHMCYYSLAERCEFLQKVIMSIELCSLMAYVRGKRVIVTSELVIVVRTPRMRKVVTHVPDDLACVLFPSLISCMYVHYGKKVDSQL